MKRNSRTIAAAVVLMAALTAACGDEVPDLTGKTQAEAEKILAESELELGTVQIGQGEGEPGTVVDQDPAAGDDVPEDKKVSLVLKGEAGSGNTSGIVPVPSLESLTVADAVTTLAEAGLVLGEQQAELHNGPSGVIFDQNPFAGAGVASGTAVNVKVASDGTVEVPAIVGQPQQSAEQMLADAGLVVGAIEQRVQSGGAVPVGGVLDSNPAPGLRVARETPVKLVIRQESTTVPKVDGLAADQARLRVFERNLTPVVRLVYDKNLGRVITQAPAFGTVVAKQSAVVLRIGTLKLLDLNILYQYKADGTQKPLTGAQVEVLKRLIARPGGGLQ